MVKWVQPNLLHFRKFFGQLVRIGAIAVWILGLGVTVKRTLCVDRPYLAVITSLASFF
jgi:hypothetical protein